MEILQTIWTALTTENESLISIFSIPLTFIEMTITMLLFTTVLSIHNNRLQKSLYVICSSLVVTISRFIIPDPYGIFINMFFFIFLVKIIFKTKFLKSVIAPMFPFALFVLVESALVKICLTVFDLQLETLQLIPIYRLPFILCVYLITFIIYKLTKHLNLSVSMLETMDKRSKILLTANFIFVFISISVQLYLTTFYSDNLPVFITLLSIISLLTYFIISIYSLTRTTQLQLATQNLEEEKLYNKTLNLLHDNIRGFKHDFNNIVSAIGGYVSTEDMEGLKSYYTELLKDCKKVNNLTVLSPSVINNSAIYSLLTSKYHQALEDGIQMDIDVFMDLNTLNIKIYEFTRIFGILLDNALEASKDCDTKLVRVTIRKDSSSNRQLCIIENTYKDKSIDTEKIFEKGFSTKNRNSGIGLWEIRQILKKLSNVNLYTSKTDDIFKQQLEIYI